MSRIQQIVMAALVVALGAGGVSAFARGKHHYGSSPYLTSNTTAAAASGVVTGQTADKPHHRHQPHGIVTAVSSGSITIEKGKKHKSKTYQVSPTVNVEKHGHGKKHGTANATAAAGTRHGKAGGRAHNHSAISEVKAGDHVRLTLSGHEVTNILDKGKGHKHSKISQTSAGLTPKV